VVEDIVEISGGKGEMIRQWRRVGTTRHLENKSPTFSLNIGKEVSNQDHPEISSMTSGVRCGII